MSQKQKLRRLELDAQVDGIRRIYQERRRRQEVRALWLARAQWLIVAAIMAVVAFSVYAGMRAQQEPPPLSLPAFEDLELP